MDKIEVLNITNNQVINKTDGLKNFTNGIDWEKEVANKLKSIGFKYAKPSIARSQEDRDKVDIISSNKKYSIPYNIQCKAVNKHLIYAKLLSSMPINDNINVVLHKQADRGEFAIMKAEDFYNMIAELQARKL